MARMKVGQAGDFKEGDKRLVSIDSKQILLVMTGGKLYAVDGRCSHMGIPLDRGTVSGGTIRCPMHGATFDLATGARLQNAQARDLGSYPVVQEGDELFIDI